MKKCSKCNEDKEDIRFALKKNRSGSYSVRSMCKDCINVRQKERRKEEDGITRDLRILKHKEWMRSNKEKVKSLKKKYRAAKKITKLSKIIHEAHVKCRNKYIKRISSMMFDQHVKVWWGCPNRRAKWETKHDINYLTNMRMRSAIRKALKGRKHGRKWESIVGYTLKDLIDHLKKTIQKGYCMEDAFNGKLHIDHIVPKSLYDMSNEENIKKAWCLSNLRLISARENLSKGDRNIFLI